MMKRILAMLLAATALTVAAQTDDINKDRAERMLGFVIENQADSLYANMSAQVKQMVQPQQLEGIMQQLEPTTGAYLSHGAWEQQEIMGQPCYATEVKFEKTELGLIVLFDPEGKMLGIQFVPLEAIKKQ